MIKNEENKKMERNDIVNNSNDLSSSTLPESCKKMRYRKDAKGNLIIRKKIQIKKSKHHAYFIDKINPNKSLVTIIDIENYKQYNLESEGEIEEINKTEEEQKLFGNEQIVFSNRCCDVF